MLEEDIRKQIIALINREVVPAVGCTGADVRVALRGSRYGAVGLPP